MGLCMQEIKIAANHDADLWFGINVKGLIHYLMRTRDGSDKIEMWWITWGVGSIEGLGRLHGAGQISIPSGFWKVLCKLRARAAVDTIVYVSDTAAVDHTLTFKW